MPLRGAVAHAGRPVDLTAAQDLRQLRRVSEGVIAYHQAGLLTKSVFHPQQTIYIIAYQALAFNHVSIHDGFTPTGNAETPFLHQRLQHRQQFRMAL